jgi:ribosomal protein S6
MENGQKQYELTCILEPHLEGVDLENFKQNLEKIAVNHNGQIKHFMEPVKKELAYPINKQGQAIYIISHLVFESSNINEFLTELKTNKLVLRYLITAMEEDTATPNTEKPKMPRKPRIRKEGIEEKSKLLDGKPFFAKAPESKDEKFNLEEIDKKLDELVGL